ncbi:LysM peptidoglycan-binding domain-containing protein [Roseivirga pacifica]|uniref:LysM peptidoglycan-binding domain-containing protein n=1 Tax=Roseivirga pacifica TaxID=1267423 RepID=UPI00227A437E
MRKPLLTIILVLFTCLQLTAQAPMIVPDQIEVAGVKLKLNNEAKKEVEETLDLLTRSQYHFQLKADRSNLYMHFVEEVLRREGIPDDFKYLAIQEGEFIADAVSTSNAVGFWQFKKASAQELGLRVDNLVDERKHIIASTVGATKYLKRSNFVFDNWVLSMQSYLQGLTGTQRSVSDKLYGAKSMNITGKSHWYIKKFIAHKLAFQDFVGDGRKHPEVALASYEGQGQTLRSVSQKVDVDYEEVKRFNKWLNQSRIPDDKSYPVIYPLKSGQKPVAQNNRPTNNTGTGSQPTTGKDKKNTSRPSSSSVRDRYGIKPVTGNTGVYPEIKGNLRNAYQPGAIKVNGIKAIKAGPNETLQTLSARTGVKVRRLRKFNDIGERGNVRPEKYYYLKNKRGKGKVHYHVVQPGETLWEISQDYGIKLKKLLRKNRMREVEQLKVGRVLWLRFIRPAHVPIEYSNVIVETKKPAAEDRLLNEVEPAKEKQPNIDRPATKTVELSLEDEVYIEPRKKKELKPEEGEEIITHTVQPKETFFGIAKRYGVEIDDILDWNDLNVMEGLQIGQELKLVVPKKPVEEPALVMHTVQAGETLWAISRKYGVSVDQILEWNDKKDANLALGEKLKIYTTK